IDMVTDNEDGSYSLDGLQIMPPADSNENFSVGVEVHSTDDEGNDLVSRLNEGSIDVEVSSVADAPELNAGDVTGTEDTPIAL
ncbi:hypothetical protein, partial [Magnetococcus sp. PR-3]|uniref:hypothetical protein n=1 Tax=Magnetococcus sp. PR-3 TaxID=3120355 RepID=UPI002FCE1058